MSSARSLLFFVTFALMAVLSLQASRAQESGEWFEVDSLNQGLGEAPDTVDRTTPQTTMESFLDAVRRGDFRAAAHLLDLSDVAPEAQETEGAALARKLGEVIERRLWLDWADLPETPDALLQSGSDSDPMAGMPRRSLRLSILDLEDRSVSIRINRLKPSNGDPVWVFSQQTVGNIEELHGLYGPGWFESKLEPHWREKSYLSLRKWELVGLPVLLLAGMLSYWLSRWLLGLLAGTAPWRAARDAAHAARTPMALFVAAGLLTYATGGLFAFSAPITTVLQPLLIAAMALAVTLAMLRAIDSLLDVVTRRYVGEIDDEFSADERSLYTSIYALRRIVLLVAVVGGAGVVMAQLHLFETLGLSLLASAGVVTVILGIAGQTVLGNILASLQIAIAKPIRIGDSVHYEGNWAYVEAIYYTFIRLRTWDGRRLIVPVQYFVSHPFENWSMQEAKMTRTFAIVLDHAAEAEALREAFFDLAKEDDDVIERHETKMLVTDQNAEGKEFTFYATAPNPTKAWEMHARLREQMLEWVEKNHPEWWPFERVVDANGRHHAARDGVVTD